MKFNIANEMLQSKTVYYPEKQAFQTEEVWEPPIEIENIKESEGENDVVDSSGKESPYWLVPQAEECLIPDEEKGELQNKVLSTSTLVSNIYKETIVPEKQKNVIGGIQFPDEQRKKW